MHCLLLVLYFRFYSNNSAFVHGGVEKAGNEQPPVIGQEVSNINPFVFSATNIPNLISHLNLILESRMSVSRIRVPLENNEKARLTQ